MEIVVLLTVLQSSGHLPFSCPETMPYQAQKVIEFTASPLSSHTKLYRNVLDTLLQHDSFYFILLSSVKFGSRLSSWTAGENGHEAQLSTFLRNPIPDVTCGRGLLS